MIEPIHDYVIRHPGPIDNLDQYYLIITLSKPMAQLDNKGADLVQSLMQIQGLEGMDPMGKYSFGIGIARTFAPDIIKEEVETAVKNALYGKILTLDKKIITP